VDVADFGKGGPADLCDSPRRLQHFHCRCLSTTAAGLADFVRSLLD
jgi:hypothetical protein